MEAIPIKEITIESETQHNNETVPASKHYELKKACAKDGSMCLNAAIDDLQLAMSLAGDQSQSRSQIMKEMIENKNDVRKKELLPLELMEKCTIEALKANKCDRPSFLKSAAELITLLNGQCEALTREIRDLYAEKKENSVIIKSDNEKKDGFSSSKSLPSECGLMKNVSNKPSAACSNHSGDTYSTKISQEMSLTHSESTMTVLETSLMDVHGKNQTK